jgi:hypothetical protein
VASFDDAFPQYVRFKILIKFYLLERPEKGVWNSQKKAIRRFGQDHAEILDQACRPQPDHWYLSICQPRWRQVDLICVQGKYS